MGKIGYVLKVYPRFSETFIVTEILAREAGGENLSIYALRPTTDSRFHPEIARVKAPVKWIGRPLRAHEHWIAMCESLPAHSHRVAFARIMPALATLPADEVIQGVILAKHILDDGITHLHVHFASLAGRVAWIASQITGIPYTVTTHAKDIFHESISIPWLRRICSDAHRVIAISEFNLNFLRRELADTPAKIELLYNGLELMRFPCEWTGSGQPPLRVLAIGRLVEKKGFDILLDAIALLKERNITLRTQIVGDGDKRQELIDQISRLGLVNEVELLGALTQQEVRQLLKESDVFVAPCRIADDGNMDGLPTVLLEAMVAGIPVLATAVTGVPEVVRNGETGILLDTAEPHSLAAALEDMAAGQRLGPEIRRAARALIEEKFDSMQQARTLRAWENAQEAIS